MEVGETKSKIMEDIKVIGLSCSEDLQKFADWLAYQKAEMEKYILSMCITEDRQGKPTAISDTTANKLIVKQKHQ